MKHLLAAAVATALFAAPVLAAEAPVLDVTPTYYSMPTTYQKCGLELAAGPQLRTFIQPNGELGHDTIMVVRDRMRCWTIYDVAQGGAGYIVRFSHEGREYTKFMAQHPGTNVTINFDAMSPVG